jgi:hypothetical protein
MIRYLPIPITISILRFGLFLMHKMTVKSASNAQNPKYFEYCYKIIM